MLTRHDDPMFSVWCVADVAVLCVIGVEKETGPRGKSVGV